MNKNKLYKVLLIRHGQSIWNHSSKFTGWTDIPLTDIGRKEAHNISYRLKHLQLIPENIYSSVLDRCIETTNIIKNNTNNNSNIYTSWRLNEKHYGTLEGIRRSYIRDEYGDKFTEMMRNNFYMKPPVLGKLPEVEPKYPIFKNCYYNAIKHGESKENLLNRLLPYFENDVLYSINQKKLPLVITHKHCIRVLMKYYLNMDDNAFEKFTIPHKHIILMFFDELYDFKGYEYIKY